MCSHEVCCAHGATASFYTCSMHTHCDTMLNDIYKSWLQGRPLRGLCSPEKYVSGSSGLLQRVQLNNHCTKIYIINFVYDGHELWRFVSKLLIDLSSGLALLLLLCELEHRGNSRTVAVCRRGRRRKMVSKQTRVRAMFEKGTGRAEMKQRSKQL